ncbi:cupin domain-containing protein [Lentzea tibetensis]|uniref:Cupin domain-containing protein n=1 Tax=Lentzea tibetensis TaxID=2591470 RepID=A0A563EEU1_9PSEU|nr:cupin domain-containing protein [Lentzea tibetensis]TWP43310.1 cupin domain-containing protein [Lentzea tibetensis]
MSRTALHVPLAEGSAKWVSGDTCTIKATAEQTNGSLGFAVAVVPPGAGPIAHVHNLNDEAFYLLDGQLEFIGGDKTFVASAGDFVFVPRGVRHRFKNLSTLTARMAFLFTPGGQERFFLEHGDDPVLGQHPEPWGLDRFTPEMLALSKQLGNVIAPE